MKQARKEWLPKSTSPKNVSRGEESKGPSPCEGRERVSGFSNSSRYSSTHITKNPQPCITQESTQVQVVQISNTSEPTVHKEISQNLQNDQEEDIEVISLEVEVMERILAKSHDVENNQ
ncbi:hypothetical protein KI387_023753, partial [Taxus chinensis]